MMKLREIYATWGMKGTLDYISAWLQTWVLEVIDLTVECTKDLINSARLIYQQPGNGFLAVLWFLSPVKLVTVEEDGEKLLMYFKLSFRKINGTWEFCQEMSKRICTLKKPQKY